MDRPYHSLLRRQLKKFFGESFSVPEEWQRFVEAVNSAYYESDVDRNMLERSLELSSRELLQANSEMRAIFEALPDLFFRFTYDGTILDCKAGNSSDLYMIRETMIGKKIDDIPIPEVRMKFRDAVRQVQETESNTNIEYVLMLGEDEQFYEARLIPILENQIIAIIRNVTKHRQAAKDISESQRRLADIIEFLPDATLVIDKEGKVIAWNRAMESMTGIKKEKMLERENYEYAIPFYGERKPILIDHVLQSGEKVRAKYRNLVWTESTLVGEAYIPNLRGKETYLIGTASILRDMKGNVTGAIESIRDITPRRHAEELYRTMANSSQVGVYIVQNERIVFANPHITQCFGYTCEELIGSCIIEYVHPEDRSKVKQQALNMIKGESSAPYEYRIIDKTGHVKWFMEVVTAIHFESTPAVLGSTMDITDRKLLEEDRKQLEQQLFQVQKSEAVGTLAGGIAHDFNNILGGITGYSELCLTEINDRPEAYDYIEQVLKAADRAKDLVKQILTFSRKMEQEKRPTILAIIVKEMIKFMRASLPATIEIRQAIDESTSTITIMADPTQMHQVLMNLCTNAGHAMKETGGVLEIGLKEIFTKVEYPLSPFLKDDCYLELSVRDSGCGIPQENIERIFDPYFTTKEKGEGTGLGLAVAHGIVKDHSGEILVKSEIGEGTIFRVYLPILRKMARDRADTEEAIPQGKGETILIVDDEEMLAYMSQVMLEKLNYKVVAETDPARAIETFKANSNNFDIIITDKTMPHITGFELSKKIRNIRVDIPIVLCSGFLEEEDIEKLSILGINQLLTKPIKMRPLAKTIRDVLDKVKFVTTKT